MGIEIRTIDPAGLEGIARAGTPDGLFMAKVMPKIMLWRACQIEGGKVARFSGSFPQVIDWLFLRARILPRGRRPKTRKIGTDNPWRIRVQIQEAQNAD